MKMGDQKAELAAIVGADNVLDAPEILKQYSEDQSFARTMQPRFVVNVKNVDEVQGIVGWANRTNTPLIPVSSGPPRFHGDTVPGAPGAVIIDLSGMKKILFVNRRNRMAVIEAGVTYTELVPVLAKNGMRLSNPLLPRANKSVVTSLLEREPRLNCRYQWASLDPLRCLEIVWGDGNRFWTGDAAMDEKDLEAQWAGKKYQIQPAGPGQTDFYRFLSGAQGSMGIATWASLKCEVLPQIHKLFFVPANKLDDLIDFTYRILKFRYADELFLMNGTNLAYVLGENPGKVDELKDKLPPWIVFVGIAGREELPEERVDFQEKDISDIAGEFGLELLPAVSGAEGEKVLEIILNPSREPYWKLDYKGGFQDFLFLTTLDKTPGFVKTIAAATEASGYPTSDIGVYIQPRHQGANCHCEFNLPYARDDAGEVSRMQKLYTSASKALLEQGAFFTRPYGIWADMAFEKDVQSTTMLKSIKAIFDPNGVMNPGKLCFELKETKEG
jgi:FAD/FMN-containing dehydrogenase